MTFKTLGAAAALLPALLACPAQADTKPAFGAPVAVGDGFSIDPIVEGRLRWEDVDQPAKSLKADAVTARLRIGAEIAHKPSHLSLTVVASGTLGLDNAYNAFPYAHPASSQYRPKDAVIADPQSVELDRLVGKYQDKTTMVAVGRQVINLDDQRWVGSVGWRQNEQTFDAVRGSLMLGPVVLDGTYSIRQHTIYGSDAGLRIKYDGDFVFLNGGIKNKVLTLKGFAYLLKYDDTPFLNLAKTRGALDSSQTYGVRGTTTLPIGQVVKLGLAGSYAVQSSYRNNPRHYKADYVAAEGNLSAYGLTATVGYEDMGADANAVGGPWAVQTPMATLHAFDGWADVFLTTPARGLKDTYGGVGYVFPKAVGVPGLNAKVVYHVFDSDIQNINYGREWDALVGFRTGFVTWTIKYAAYHQDGLASLGSGTTTKKVWLQSEFAF